MTQKSGFDRRKEFSQITYSDIEIEHNRNNRLGAKQTPMESSIVTRILAWLNKQPGCHAEKTHGSAWGSSGKPDITGCMWGLRFELEVKVPGKDATPLQKVKLKEWAASGALVGVVHSLDEVKVLFDEWIKGRGKTG